MKGVPKGQVHRYDYLLQHMWEPCVKWPFAKVPFGYGVLRHDGRNTTAHRLVCTIVHGPPPTPLHQAAHNCGKGHEGCFSALCVEWKTRAENREDELIHGTRPRGERHGHAKLKQDEVIAIRSSPLSDKEAGVLYGVSRATISDLRAKRTWAWL